MYDLEAAHEIINKQLSALIKKTNLKPINNLRASFQSNCSEKKLLKIIKAGKLRTRFLKH